MYSMEWVYPNSETMQNMVHVGAVILFGLHWLVTLGKASCCSFQFTNIIHNSFSLVTNIIISSKTQVSSQSLPKRLFSMRCSVACFADDNVSWHDKAYGSIA